MALDGWSVAMAASVGRDAEQVWEDTEVASACYGTRGHQPAVTVTCAYPVPWVTKCLQGHSLPFSASFVPSTGIGWHPVSVCRMGK